MQELTSGVTAQQRWYLNLAFRVRSTTASAVYTTSEPGNLTYSREAVAAHHRQIAADGELLRSRRTTSNYLPRIEQGIAVSSCTPDRGGWPPCGFPGNLSPTFF